ncbi:MAG: hypothetical protein JRJ45_00480 [Deltaproteobacteria bacterium]|nr:hypothetical protein [Deltaproteobacteria bacterium]
MMTNEEQLNSLFMQQENLALKHTLTTKEIEKLKPLVEAERADREKAAKEAELKGDK